jgi:hypothetical protein
MSRRVYWFAALLSAGIVTTVHAQGASWRLSTQPVARVGIGESDGDMLLAPSGATKLPNGNFVVGDVDAFAIKEYSASGKFLRKYGRKGNGPGEISYIFPLMRCGDALVANDLGGGPAQLVFDHDGTYKRKFRIPAQIYRLSCNTHLQFAVTGWEIRGMAKEGSYRPVSPYLLARADSTTPILLGELPGPDRIGNRPLPLGRDPRMAIGPNRVYIGLGDSLHILVYDLSGKPLPALSARAPRIATTPADFTAEMEREIAMVGEKARPAIEKQYATMTPPKFLPATRDLIVDADGNLWVQHFPRATAKTVTWTTFSPAGRVLATTAVPTDLEVYEIGRDYVLGRIVNDDGIPEVRAYALTR